MAGLSLPDSFSARPDSNVLCAVEHAFASASVHRGAVERRSRGPHGRDCLLFEMEMSLSNRGGFIGWLSQYPHEGEILLGPLTALEVRGALTFHCPLRDAALSLTFCCLSLTLHCLSLTFRCLSMRFIDLPLSPSRWPPAASSSTRGPKW